MTANERSDDEAGRMANRSVLRVRNGTERRIVLVVEPWAEELDLSPEFEYEVVAIHPDRQPTLGVEQRLDRLVVWVDEGGSLCEVWRDGVQVY
jgi:hypothetical protein